MFFFFFLGEDSSLYSEAFGYDFNIFSHLFILFLFFYVNLNLKKATFMVSSIYTILLVLTTSMKSKFYFGYFDDLYDSYFIVINLYLNQHGLLLSIYIKLNRLLNFRHCN